MRKRTWGVLLLVACLCGCDNNNNGNANPNPPNGTLALQAADMPGVDPCPCQTILQDDTELTALKNALTSGTSTIVHLDVPFNAGDADIYRKKCGLEGYWNPAAAVDEVAAFVTPVTLSSLITAENAGICAANFDNGSFGTGEGFPVAGTYRKEFKVTDQGTTWHMRLRITVSGTSAGNTFAAESISVPGDIESTLVYEIDGLATPHGNVIAAGINALAADMDDAPSFTLDVRKSAAGPIVFTAVVELICVSKTP